MAKLSITANLTFSAPVPVPVAGGEPVMVNFTFKHRTKNDLSALAESRAGRSDADIMMDIVTGWDMAEDFGRDNVELALQQRIGLGLACWGVYVDELVKARVKN